MRSDSDCALCSVHLLAPNVVLCSDNSRARSVAAFIARLISLCKFASNNISVIAISVVPAGDVTCRLNSSRDDCPTSASLAAPRIVLIASLVASSVVICPYQEWYPKTLLSLFRRQHSLIHLNSSLFQFAGNCPWNTAVTAAQEQSNTADDCRAYKFSLFFPW